MLTKGRAASTRNAPLLIVIDLQPGFDDPQFGTRNNPQCEARVAELLRAWRDQGFAVFFTRYLSSRQGSPLSENDVRSRIKDEVRPRQGEAIFDKRTNSAFKAQGFSEAVASLAPSTIVLTGIATDVCITATAREALDLGCQVTVASDACATFERTSQSGMNYSAENVHHVALAALATSGAAITSTQSLIELLADGASSASREP